MVSLLAPWYTSSLSTQFWNNSILLVFLSLIAFTWALLQTINRDTSPTLPLVSFVLNFSDFITSMMSPYLSLSRQGLAFSNRNYSFSRSSYGVNSYPNAFFAATDNLPLGEGFIIIASN